ncbi:MAG: malto-oligosyltrehalose synthase [Verrucomicrobia bacterium]|nr:MAG: malto-oligosyltrehalose synthase [Verrucomicrobiota bacterium]PYK33883.1 MAG: malto-oligosyltrehalose synthase [Verrucomicrobiota bacterium]
MTKEQRPRIPGCTYRLQFNRWFTFLQAREIMPYLHALGVTDVYASPYSQASAESLHGYDITDHNKLNAAIGSRADYDSWIEELHAHSMGQVLDFVPNHVGIAESLNAWWMDVLENGPSSRYAPYFDIDWHPLKFDLRDKVLLPILSDQYGRVLERGELQLRFEEGTFYLLYGERRLPIAPGTYRYVLQIALENLAEHKEEDFYAELQSILTALEYLPKRTETDPKRIAERIREKEVIKRRLERRCAEAPQVQRAIEKALAQINGKPGDPRSFDALDELLNAQSYRLAFWRVAAEEINYRRFFDVNDLAAIRVELPKVFDAVHRLALDLVSAGAVTGLRIDHPDGLYLPREYFEKLQQRCAKALGIGLPQDGRAIYMLAEKILTASEALRKDWLMHGTTGYDFANQVTQLLVDSSAETAITKTFHRFIGHSMPFGHLLYAKKLQVMKLALANDVDVLSNMLDRLSEQNRWYRDFTLESLSRAVRETIACFPVYRTYLTPGQPVSEEDRQIVERAITAAKRRNPAMEESIFNFLRDVLLFRFPPNLDDAGRTAHTHFVLKFQQTTGPVMAKGLEDTVFYIYNRLAALNEVGGEPQQFGLTAEAFHERNIDRQRNWPATLLATSTHDTKRSEDVRARMVAISEIPELWRRSLQRWRVANHRWKGTINDVEAPDANEEYLLYQTLLGTWPIEANGEPQPAATPEYIERIQRYMAKALHEAKINTSWIQPNEEWDTAMRDFVANILDSSPRNKFLPIFLPVAQEIARLGAINSLTQTLLKLTSPGVPDVYQGNEIWDYSLVDPDNRRRVDYNRRREMLETLSTATPHELIQTWPDGRIKMFLTQRVLRFHREHADLFQHGEYLPLRASGTFAECCVSFTRQLADKWILVIVPRLSSRVGFPPIGEAWKDTAIQLPEALPVAQAHDLFTCRPVPLQDRQVNLADPLSIVPFAVITDL